MDTEFIKEMVLLAGNIGAPAVILVLGIFAFVKVFPLWEKEKARQAEKDGEWKELVRNCSAVIENNTAAFRAWERNEAMLAASLEHLSEENRDANKRIETKIAGIANSNDRLVTKVAVISSQLESR